MHIYVLKYTSETFPTAAGVRSSQGLYPLFLSVMRNNAIFEISKALCKAFPNGPQTLNKTDCHPLHFALYRHKPNREIVKMLLRRYPEATRKRNKYGQLPFHCGCLKTDDIFTLKLVLDVYPEAISHKCTCNLGKTSLHMAVSAIGKEHEEAGECTYIHVYI